MSSNAPARPMAAIASQVLEGDIRVPGDKSMSHRALIFGAMAVGTTRITGLLEGEDVINTAKAVEAMGARAERLGTGEWQVTGCGIGGFREPEGVLDFGNSGTGVRLLMGVLASQEFTTFCMGDASLHKRPMERVMKPLRIMGADFISRSKGRLPLAVRGSTGLRPISYELPVPSAQVKSAVLLAGLNTPGQTTVIETEATRDHTENMLRLFGANVSVTDKDGKRTITLDGQPELVATDFDVPTDPSSAAFPAVAAAICPGSNVVIRNVCLNPLRAGLYTCLEEMGADISYENERDNGGERVADIRVRGSKLKGITVPADRAPSMIDEYPVLSVAAACAEGVTEMRGLAELRVKESDRLDAVARGLEANGVSLEEYDDGLKITGIGDRNGGLVTGGGLVETRLDHRIAMAFLVMGLRSVQPVRIDDAAPIDTSFPGFVTLMRDLGADLQDSHSR